MNHHIAVDIGASSGRLVAGELRDGLITLREIHRFDNGFAEKTGIFTGISIICSGKFCGD
ncbi:hypothetical protein HMSSN036_42430 [Paenibacillus macerans]|nr:hypothetical protein HMSSN036_42430 [Paenibacillus macerans]